MSYYTYMSPNWQKVYWIYGFEIDYDIIERIDKERAFFSSYTEDNYTESIFDYDDGCFTDATERVTDYLRREFDCIAPMLGWDADSATKEKTYILVVHAHDTPKRSREREMVMRRIARVKRELMPDVKARAKWYFACEAGVWKGDVDWGSKPGPFDDNLRRKVTRKADAGWKEV